MGLKTVISYAGLFLSLSFNMVAQTDRLKIIDSIANPKLSASGIEMEFDAIVLDAGTIAEDAAPPVYEFTWTNRGERPVTVLKVSTSCSCLVPEYSRTPVAPGDKSSLKVTYHPKGRPGDFSRRILVYTDRSGSMPAVLLRLEGTVTPAAVPVWSFHHQMGSLYLKQKEVRFSGEGRAVERISCLNAGDRPLTIGAETALLPPYLAFRCEPETIPPGGRGELVVTFDPDASPVRMLDYVPLILTGLDLPPSQRTVRVLFGTGR